MAIVQQQQSSEPAPAMVEVRFLSAKIVRELEEWVRLCRAKGGFGECWIEVADGEIKRIKPQVSLLASKL